MNRSSSGTVGLMVLKIVSTAWLSSGGAYPGHAIFVDSDRRGSSK